MAKLSASALALAKLRLDVAKECQSILDVAARWQKVADQEAAKGYPSPTLLESAENAAWAVGRILYVLDGGESLDRGFPEEMIVARELLRSARADLDAREAPK